MIKSIGFFFLSVTNIWEMTLLLVYNTIWPWFTNTKKTDFVYCLSPGCRHTFLFELLPAQTVVLSSDGKIGTHPEAAESNAGASRLKNPSQENTILAQLGDIILYRIEEAQNGCSWKGPLEAIVVQRPYSSRPMQSGLPTHTPW